MGAWGTVPSVPSLVSPHCPSPDPQQGSQHRQRGHPAPHRPPPAGWPHSALPAGAGHRGGHELHQPTRPQRRAGRVLPGDRHPPAGCWVGVKVVCPSPPLYFLPAGDPPPHGRSTPKWHPPAGAQGSGGAAGCWAGGAHPRGERVLPGDPQPVTGAGAGGVLPRVLGRGSG